MYGRILQCTVLATYTSLYHSSYTYLPTQKKNAKLFHVVFYNELKYTCMTNTPIKKDEANNLTYTTHHAAIQISCFGSVISAITIFCTHVHIPTYIYTLCYIINITQNVYYIIVLFAYQLNTPLTDTISFATQQTAS